MPFINSDPAEKIKFDRLSAQWWDPRGPLSALHDINGLRLDWILSIEADLAGKAIVDVGCGGGILTEALAGTGANVTGIDISKEAIVVAKDHARRQSLAIDYQIGSAEDFCQTRRGAFDVVCCMELLEHVPNYAGTITACAHLLKPRGRAFFSTINRTAKAWLLAIAVAEYGLNLLPRRTHNFSRFIRPSELVSAAESVGLLPTKMVGIAYSPLRSKRARLTENLSVNYMVTTLYDETRL